MKNKLPRVYSNPINKEIKNNKEYDYRSLKEEKIQSPKDISKEVNRIFSRKDFVYKKKVYLKTYDQEEEVTLVGRTNTAVLTMDGKTIPIVNITEIKIQE